MDMESRKARDMNMMENMKMEREGRAFSSGKLPKIMRKRNTFIKANSMKKVNSKVKVYAYFY